jgi:ribose-phosphate pyrophosphokinase
MARCAGVYGFPDSRDGARRLADALGVPCHIAEVHRFPDGESLVRLPEAVEDAVVYRSLDRPNDKLIELALAASVLRRQGARRLSLVAPYLAYMRQDAVFRPGEPVSQTVIGAWLAQMFDRLVTVEPHLHRTPLLDQVFAGRPGVALSGAEPIARHLLASGVAPGTVIVGPDEESAPLVEGIAGRLGLEGVVGRKVRHGDRDVAVDLPPFPFAGRPVVIVDDVISSGATIFTCADEIRRRGGEPALVCGVHALFPEEVAERFDAERLPVVSCDGVPHASNAIPLAAMIAAACED